MLPAIKPNDLIIYKRFNPNNFEPKAGLIIVVNNPLDKQKLLIKRIASFNSKGLFIKGDNDEGSWDSRHFGNINYSSIKGIVTNIMPKKITKVLE